MFAVELTADGSYSIGVILGDATRFSVGHSHSKLKDCALALLIGGQQCTVLIVDDHAEILKVSSRSRLCHSQHRQEHHKHLLHLFC